MDESKIQNPTGPKATVLDVIKQFIIGLKPYKLLLAVVWGGVIFTTILQVYIPILYKDFFDVLSSTTDKNVAAPQLISILIKILIINLVMWVGHRIVTINDATLQNKVPARLRETAFGYMINHSYTFFSNNFGGSLVQKVGRYTRAYGKLMDQITWSLLPITVNIIGVIYVLWKVEPALSIGIFVWAMVFLIFNYAFSRFKSKYDILSSEADSRTTGYLSDVITNNNTVQLFTGVKYEKKEFHSVVDAQTKASLFAWRLSNINQAVQSGLVVILEFFVLYFAVRYWQTGVFTVGTFVLIQAYIIGLGDRLWGFARVVRAIYESYADGKEMVEIMAIPHEVQDIPRAKPLSITKGEIEFKNLTFNYNQTRTVLNTINLKIIPGEKIALIGPSGAGKSTIVRLILRLYEVTSGSISIDGQNIHEVTLNSLRENISYVPQEPILFHRSLKENIRYGRRDATDEEVQEAARLAHCEEFIKDLPLKYDTLVGERGIKLSGGERQRIAIARAILKNAPILILDEATSSLDSGSEHLIQDALDVLMKDKTVIVIAHRLSTIRKMDRIVVIDNGQVTEQGTHDELLQIDGSLYSKLWNLQAGGFLKEEEEKV
ncbi:ABC transporter ATP-binding protein [Patescibacteria group bacterium]|nr:ABC transporter ATP-binding protein [Patescibacteria group bacterium]